LCSQASYSSFYLIRFYAQGFIIFLNIFVIFIPFIQYLVIRRPAHGNQSIAERVAEAAASSLGIPTPFGLRASKAAFERRNSSARSPLPADRKLIISFLPGGLPRTPVLGPFAFGHVSGVPSVSVLNQKSEIEPETAAEAAAAGLFNSSKRQLQLQRVREANTKSYLLKRSKSGSNPRGSLSLTHTCSVQEDSGGLSQGMHAAVAAANKAFLAEDAGITEQQLLPESPDSSSLSLTSGIAAGFGFPYSPWTDGWQEHGKRPEMDDITSPALSSMLLVDQLGFYFSRKPVEVVEFAI
jgi:hypothetical protein